MFTANDVEKAFKELLNNPSYARNIKKLQELSNASGGRVVAAKAIEDVHQYGSDHLIDYEYEKRQRSMNCCCFNCFTLFVLAFVSVFIWLLIEYIQSV